MAAQLKSSKLQTLVDDAILLLASAHQASFEADLRHGMAGDASDDDESSGSDGDNQLAADDAEDAELQRLRWDCVANGVRATVRAFTTGQARERALIESRDSTALSADDVLKGQHHPAGTKRTSTSSVTHLRHGAVDFISEMNGETCQQRARYLVWRQQRERESASASSSRRRAKGVSDFNVARGDSLAHRVDQILKEATKNLPSAAAEASDDDDDDDAPVEIYQPPAHMRLTEEETRQQQAMHQAEDDLMQRIQAMQKEHFDTYRKWIDVDPLNFTTAASTSAARGGRHHHPSAAVKSQLTPQAGRSPDSSAAAARPRLGTSVASSTGGEGAKPLEEYNIADVAMLCAELGIDAEPFRRTSGRVLATLTEEDLKLRMPVSTDAQRHKLFAAIQARRSRGPPSSVGGGSAARGAASELYTQTRGGGQAGSPGNIAAMLADASDATTPGGSRERERLRAGLATDSDPLADLKKRLAGIQAGLASGGSGSSGAGAGSESRRPTRPSRMSEDEYEAAVIEDFGGADEEAAAAVPAPRRHVDPAPAAKSAAAAAAAPAKSTAAPQRAGRWAIVEYSDDDADEDAAA